MIIITNICLAFTRCFTYITYTSQQPFVVGTIISPILEKREQRFRKETWKLAQDDKPRWRQSQPLDFNPFYFQSICNVVQISMSNAQRDCVLICLFRIGTCFLTETTSKGQGVQINPQRLIYALMLFSFIYLQEKMQEQDVSMVVMKVNTMVDAVNEERFLNLKHLSWGTQK